MSEIAHKADTGRMTKLVAHAIQMCSDELPYGKTVVAFQLEGTLYGATAEYYPDYDKDGKPTGRRRLEIKVKQIDHPGELE